jgi:hypothetical protein
LVRPAQHPGEQLGHARVGDRDAVARIGQQHGVGGVLQRFGQAVLR